jgi:hypothetical protein
MWAGEKEEDGGPHWAGMREGKEGMFWEFFKKNLFTLFFKLLKFQTFCKLHSNNKTTHSNHDAQALIASKLLK